jgi:hypothetical protein
MKSRVHIDESNENSELFSDALPTFGPVDFNREPTQLLAHELTAALADWETEGGLIPETI